MRSDPPLPDTAARPVFCRRSRLDYLFIPCISAVTILAFGTIVEQGSRILFTTQSDSCEMVTGRGFIPNCTSSQKIPEGPAVGNHYNECGYRTAEPCGRKPANGIRVAVIGTSISRGYAVAYSDSFAAKATIELSKRCAQPVELQNLSIMWREPLGPEWDQFDSRVEEALGLDPDIVMFMLSSWDIWKYRDESVDASVEDSVAIPSGPKKFDRMPFYPEFHAMAQFVRGQYWTLHGMLQSLQNQSRAILLLRRVIYSDSDTLVRLYLATGDESDYLRTPFTNAWRIRLDFVNSLMDRLSLQAGSRHVPVVMAFVPFAAHAALAGLNTVEPNLDPFGFSRAIGAISAKHNAQYIDALYLMSRVPRPTEMYYVVNGHPNALGHAIIANAVVSRLLQSSPFAHCQPSHRAESVGIR
jgi:hypothetical protein